MLHASPLHRFTPRSLTQPRQIAAPPPQPFAVPGNAPQHPETREKSSKAFAKRASCSALWKCLPTATIVVRAGPRPAPRHSPLLDSPHMSFDRRSHPLTQRLVLALGAALLVTSAAHAAEATLANPANEPADVCPALKHIVDAADFRQLQTQPAAQLPGIVDRRRLPRQHARVRLSLACALASQRCRQRSARRIRRRYRGLLSERRARRQHADAPAFHRDHRRAARERHGKRARSKRTAPARHALIEPDPSYAL